MTFSESKARQDATIRYGEAVGEELAVPSSFSMLGRLKAIFDAIMGRTGGVISSGNSTTTVLTPGQKFEGAAEEVTHYAIIHILVRSSHDSAVDGLLFEYSSDGTNWDDSDAYTIPANKGKFFTVPAEAKFFRVSYTNGGTLQTEFRLQVIYKYAYGKPSSHKIVSDITDEEDTELVRAILSGKTPSGVYRNVILDSKNRVITAPPSAAVTNKGFIDGKVSINSLALTAVRNTTYTEPSSAAQRSFVSSSASDGVGGTGARSLEVVYYDNTLNGPFTEVVTLDGVTPVNTVAVNIRFIESIRVLTAGSGGKNVGIISLKEGTEGTGNTIWSVAVGDNKTFGAHHYVADGLVCSVTGLMIGSKGTTVSGHLRARNPLQADGVEVQVTDLLRAMAASTYFRPYASPVEVVGPALVTAYTEGDSASPHTYLASFDYYEE